jgi:crossover junction endodeoxyribonuclease RusA
MNAAHAVSFGFWVDGVPQPQGSVKSVGAHRVIHSNDKALRPFREAVAYHAVQARPDGWGTNAPCLVALTFMFNRPASAPKRNPPAYKSTRPDLDKLVRAVLDGLTGVVFCDDARVVELTAVKRYSDEDRPGVFVFIRVIGLVP